jgi:hypothetical protein
MVVDEKTNPRRRSLVFFVSGVPLAVALPICVVVVPPVFRERLAFCAMVPLSPSSSPRRQHLAVGWLLSTLVITAAVVSAESTSLQRQLEQNNNNNQAVVEGYEIRQGTCFRVKVDQDNDDDGNAYFYNGAYRSQYQRYMSFAFCDSDSKECQTYVTELDTFVETAVSYVQTYCNSCANQCNKRRNRRRFLADQQQQQANYNVDCNTCANECSLLLNNNNGDDNALDESQYLDCQQAAASNDEENGLKYYTAPQCENGQVVMGHFYDNKCTIKTSTLQDAGFSYRTFRTVASMAVLCDIDGDSCQDLFKESIYCGENYEDGEQEGSLCKAAKAAGRTYTYYKKPFYKKVPVVSIGFLILMLTSAFTFLAYTYYVRHSRSKVIPLAQLDGGEAVVDPEHKNIKEDLPPIS